MKHVFALCIIVAAAIAISGCICFSGQRAPQAEPTAVNATPAAVSPQTLPSVSPTVAQAVQSPHPFDMDKAQWVEYQETDGEGGSSSVRLEYSTKDVSGVSVKTVKRTVSYSGSGSSGDGYSYDPDTNTLHIRTSGSSSYSSTGMETSVDQVKADDPVLAAGDLSYSLIGQETVTVPKGTYQCDKYVSSLNGAEATYWAAAGVPVPIKIARGDEMLALSDFG